MKKTQTDPSNLQKHIAGIMAINQCTKGDRDSVELKAINERLSTIWLKANSKRNGWIKNIVDGIEAGMWATKTQARMLARFADENGIIFK